MEKLKPKKRRRTVSSLERHHNQVEANRNDGPLLELGTEKGIEAIKASCDNDGTRRTVHALTVMPFFVEAMHNDASLVSTTSRALGR